MRSRKCQECVDQLPFVLKGNCKYVYCAIGNNVEFAKLVSVIIYTNVLFCYIKSIEILAHLRLLVSITETSPYKVTPDFYLTYSKNGGILVSESK